MWARLEPSILSGAPPKARHCHAGATYGDKIIYFGGTDGKERYNDVYVFDTARSGWLLLKTKGSVPSARYCASIVVWRDLLVLFGGFDSQRLNSLYVLDLRTFEWSPIFAAGAIPGARSHHTMVVSGSKAFIFGGLRNDGKVLNDLFMLDMERWQWLQLFPRGTVPCGRLGHIGCLIDDQTFFIYGGYDGKVRLSDCYVLRLDTLCWSEPLVTGPSPSKRLGHCGISVGSKVLVFGGDDGNTERTLLSDIWIFDLSSLQWSVAAVQNQDEAPHGRIHATLSLVGQHEVFLFGGSGYRKKKYDDVYKLDISGIPMIQNHYFSKNLDDVVSHVKEAAMELRTLRQAAADLSRGSTSVSSSSKTEITPIPSVVVATTGNQSWAPSPAALAVLDALASGTSAEKGTLSTSGGHQIISPGAGQPSEPSSSTAATSSDDHTSGTESGSGNSPRPPDDLRAAGRSLSGGIIVSSPSSLIAARSTSPPSQRPKEREKDKSSKDKTSSTSTDAVSPQGSGRIGKKKLKSKQNQLAAESSQASKSTQASPPPPQPVAASSLDAARGRPEKRSRGAPKSRSRSTSAESSSSHSSDASDDSRASIESDRSGLNSRSPSPPPIRQPPVGAFALGDKVKGVLSRLMKEETPAAAPEPSRTDVDAVDRVVRAGASPITSAEQSPAVSPSVSPRQQSYLLNNGRRRPDAPFASDLEFGPSSQTSTPMTAEDKLFYSKVDGMLTKLHNTNSILKRAKSELSRLREKLQSEVVQQDIKSDEQRQRQRIQDAYIEEIITQQHKKVTLNVGGVLFETSIAVLTKEKQSMLAAMFSGRYSMNKEADGTYFIDRDGERFGFILNYLRYGSDFVLEPKKSLYLDLIQDATYFQLDGLRDLLLEQIESGTIVDDPVVEF